MNTHRVISRQALPPDSPRSESSQMVFRCANNRARPTFLSSPQYFSAKISQLSRFPRYLCKTAVSCFATYTRICLPHHRCLECVNTCAFYGKGGRAARFVLIKATGGRHLSAKPAKNRQQKFASRIQRIAVPSIVHPLERIGARRCEPVNSDKAVAKAATDGKKGKETPFCNFSPCRNVRRK